MKCTWLGLVVAVAGCEQIAIVDGTIVVDLQTTPVVPAPILVTSRGFARPDDTWDPVGETGQAIAEDFVPGRLAYHYRWEQFGRPPHALYFAAFLDLDGNGVLSAHEPFGTFAANPMIDARWGYSAAATTADITINMTAP